MLGNTNTYKVDLGHFSDLSHRGMDDGIVHR